MTAEKLLLLPVIIHFFMTFAIAGMMGRARFTAVRSGRVKRSDIVNNSKAWPEDVLKIGNNFDNQFQLPMLWYACIGFALITGMVDTLLVVLAWVFLASRMAHSFVHVGGNTLPLRFYVYLAGFAVLMLMWLWFSLKYFVIG